MVGIEYEIHQQHINAQRMPLCVGRLRKLAHADSNWEYYIEPDSGICYALAKPGSGAKTCVFGTIAHVKRCVRRGAIDAHNLTKYGRRLCT